MHFIRAAENLQVSAHSVRRWRATLQVQDTTNPQRRDDATHNHRGPTGFLDDIQEELIAFVTDWRDRGMPVTRFALVRKIGRLKPEFLLKSSTARLMCISCASFLRTILFIVLRHTRRSALRMRCTKTRSRTLFWLCPSAWDQLGIQGLSSTWTRPTRSLVTRPVRPSINAAHAPSTCAQALMPASAVQLGAVLIKN